MVSVSDKCKRALVSLIRSLALFHQVVTSVTRDSVDVDVRKAYRTLSKKTHPDHGGHVQDQQRLNAAYEEWCDAAFQKTSTKQRGKNKAKGASVPALLPTQGGEVCLVWIAGRTCRRLGQFFGSVRPLSCFCKELCTGLVRHTVDSHSGNQRRQQTPHASHDAVHHPKKQELVGLLL